MTDTQKLQYLAGQMNGMMSFLVAMIASHRDLPRLAEDFERFSEKQMSQSLPLPVTEEFLQGQKDICRDIASVLATALAERGGSR